MIDYHYDVCILAESPATYISAEILARKGYRILLCENNVDNPSQFKSYYPFYFSTDGPLMETIRALGLEKLFMNKIEPLSIQVVLPSGRCELSKNTERRTEELEWLLGGHFESEMNNLKKLDVLSDKIRKVLSPFLDVKYKIKDRILLWFLKKRLSSESILINNQSEHFFSILSGDSCVLEGYPDTFTDLIKKNLSKKIEILHLADIQIDKKLRYIRSGGEAITFKFMVVDSALVKTIFTESRDKTFRNLVPLSFWFPLQLRIKKEGFPIGMGKYVLLINPDPLPQDANLVYIKTDKNVDEVILNTYSVWGVEELTKQKWVENIVGSIMDRLIEFMPFVNNHLLNLVYPEKVEDLPPNFFNYLYDLRRKVGLFSPVIKGRLQRRVFVAGAELFPQWGIDSDAMAANYVTKRIIRMMKG